MEPDIVDTAVLASMDAKLMIEMSCLDSNVSFMCESISQEIVCLFLFVVFVVRGNYVYFLS
jgi:hypothetical protein